MFAPLSLLALFITNLFSLNDNKLHNIGHGFLLLSTFLLFTRCARSTRTFLKPSFILNPYTKHLLNMLFTFLPSFITHFFNSIDPQIFSSRYIFKVYQLAVTKFWIYFGLLDFINLDTNTFIFFSKLFIFCKLKTCFEVIYFDF